MAPGVPVVLMGWMRMEVKHLVPGWSLYSVSVGAQSWRLRWDCIPAARTVEARQGQCFTPALDLGSIFLLQPLVKWALQRLAWLVEWRPRLRKRFQGAPWGSAASGFPHWVWGPHVFWGPPHKQLLGCNWSWWTAG